jgi:thiamine-phosphate pyrophosphorylase
LAFTYYITARLQLNGPIWASAEDALAAKTREAFGAGIDYVQVREKDLPTRQLAHIVTSLADRKEKISTTLLVNDRIDIAICCGADGVHLPSDSVPIGTARELMGETATVGISCHTEQEAVEASASGASYILLAPIFETPSKPGVKPIGLETLAKVCSGSSVPVFALGGVNEQNAEACVRAGASGIAGIRLYQQSADLNALCRYIHSLRR